jgi:hypothetical protein
LEPWRNNSDPDHAAGIIRRAPLDLNQVPSQSQAQRLAKIYMSKRNPAWNGQVRTSFAGLDAIGQSTVSLTFDELHTDEDPFNGPFYVNGLVSFLPDRTGLTFPVASADPAAYDWTAAEEQYLPGEDPGVVVTLTAPADGATVLGAVTVSATASAVAGVASVQFKRGSTNIGAADTGAPYSVSWDTTGVTNGDYTITAIATDTLGNTETSDPRTVTVANVIAVGGAAEIADETSGLGVAFDYATDADRVAVKVGGVVTASGLDAFFQNEGTGPKLVTDASGVLRWTDHNLFLNSEAPATQSVTTIIGAQYFVKVTGTGSMVGSGGASGTATQAAPLVFIATTTASTFTLSGSLTRIQMNRGNSATAYLATTSARRYGLAIDHHPTLGRTLLSEHSSSNFCLWSNDLTQTLWVKSNATATLTATGPLGVANSATVLTATAANATALQTITAASSVRITSAFLKRRTGSGNIELTQDNGATWTTQAVSSSWERFALAEVTSTNPTFGIRIVTSGDAVDVALFQHENSTIARLATSPYPTWGVLQTRAADNYTFLLSAIPALGSEYSFYSKWAVPSGSAAIAGGPVAITDGTANEQAKFAHLTGAVRLQVLDGGSLVGNITGSALTSDTLMKAAARIKLNDCAMSQNGGTVLTDTSVTLPTVTQVRLGNAGASASASNVLRLKTLVIVPRAWSNTELQARTA